MKHEIILKRQDGSRVQIIVRMFVDNLRGSFNYDISVAICGPRKRTWRWIASSHDYRYRGETPIQRAAMLLDEQLKHVTREEILAAKLALWEKIWRRLRKNLKPITTNNTSGIKTGI